MDNVDLNFRMMASGNAVPELRKAQNGVKRLGDQIDRSQARMRGFNNGITTMQANTRKFAMGSLQQAGYQLGDYAVQVANGTSKMQAFGQQAPQFLQIFGPIGAIVGAGVAILAAIGVAFEKSANAAKEASGDLMSFKEAMGKAGSATQEASAAISAAASKNIENARKKFSDFDGDLKGYLETMARVRRDQALTAVSLAANKFFDEQDALSSLRDEYTGFISDSQNYKAALREEQAQRKLSIAAYELEISALKSLADAQDNTGVIGASLVTRNQIAELSKELDAIRKNSVEPFMSSLSLPQSTIQDLLIFENAIKAAFSGGNLDGAVTLLGQMRETIDGLPQPVREQLLPALLEMEGLARRAGVELATTAEETDKSASAAQNLTVKLSQATAQARELSKAIASAPLALKSMQDQTLIIEAELAAIKSGYTQIEASSAAYRKQRELELGLSEAGSAAEQAYLSAIINKDVKSFEARARANAELVKARKAFDELSNSGSSAISKLTNGVNGELSPAMKRLKSIQDTVSSSFENGFMSIVDGTKSVKDAFKSMASEIIKELYRIFVVKKITGMISGAIGGFGSAAPTTSLRPVARPTSFSGGGYTGNGARAGGLDGKGGYMAMIHPRETVVDHTKGQRTGGVTVNQYNTFGSGVSRAEVNAMLPKMVEATKAAVVDAKLRGGSYGRSFA